MAKVNKRHVDFRGTPLSEKKNIWLENLNPNFAKFFIGSSLPERKVTNKITQNS